jgi:hypothetical protein
MLLVNFACVLCWFIYSNEPVCLIMYTVMFFRFVIARSDGRNKKLVFTKVQKTTVFNRAKNRVKTVLLQYMG